jgi:hypothetical protein
VWLREIEGKNKNLWAIFEGKNLTLPSISPPPIALFEFSSLYVVWILEVLVNDWVVDFFFFWGGTFQVTDYIYQINKDFFF